MFFLASKLAWLLLAPVQALALAALVGAAAASRFPRLGRRIAIAASAALVLVAILPVGVWLLRPLEDRFPRPAADFPPPAGIIVLGGAIDSAVTAARGSVALTDGAERLTEAAVLARRYPDARIVYVGGSNKLVGAEPPEAAEGKRLLVSLGVSADRILIETRSRNTDENARFARDLLSPKPAETWLLVTSAFHMPRAMGAFRRAGFTVIADPVDYRSEGDGGDWRLNREATLGLRDFDAAIHEWIGLIAYRLTGKTDDWLPGP
ncbi:MAG TPA: YdcF family protein [Roseiarcus sp.]|nr:YdcF family protein [Roseiarcus sp.]